MGWATPLTITERDKLRAEVARGAVDREALKRMNLAPIDRYAAEIHLPKVKTPSGGNASVPDAIARIAATIVEKTSPPVREPIEFLRNTDDRD